MQSLKRSDWFNSILVCKYGLVAGSEINFSIKGQYLSPEIDFRGIFTIVRAVFLITLLIVSVLSLMSNTLTN